MTMTSMQLTPQEAKEGYGGSVSPDGDNDLPKYPVGLSLRLDDDTLAKLGITSQPAVGTTMQLVATVEVCSTSKYENQDRTESSLSLQITDMELSASAGKSLADTLYAK